MYEKQQQRQQQAPLSSSSSSSSVVSTDSMMSTQSQQNHKNNLEDIYIMGNRIVCFLAEYLPKHPHYLKREVSQIRSWSIQELEYMKHCLDDIALLIDEEQLNKYITVDFDPTIELDDEDDDDEDGVVVDLKKWDPFAASASSTAAARKCVSGSNSISSCNNSVSSASVRSNVDSPTVETVGTTGTGSFVAIDETSSEDSTSDRELGGFNFAGSGNGNGGGYRHTHHNNQYSPGGGAPPSPRYVFRLDAEFLERIAQGMSIAWRLKGYKDLVCVRGSSTMLTHFYSFCCLC